ncbi:hypothetical protein BD410DRAFT_789976 [Rickenella mellea]|uniref:F-box domain-containing protein n=1 Tax=Rickenella mellea TaxID=50990 RepID=A0A4Y7Q235_9AGAM|nr:hypothetical protein BD410DRAFT_789976 [Rickenella mellea]
MLENTHNCVDRKAELSKLPDELLVKILRNLDATSLLRAQQANVRLCNLIKSEKALQYQLELFIAGMVDGPESAPFTLEERMARLKEYTSAWEFLDRKEPETFKVREPGIWNMTGGLLSYGRFSGTGYGGTTITTLVFKKLASRTRCIEGRVWSYDIPGKVHLMETDLYQDLLILVTTDPTTEAQSVIMHIAFHQLSTGEAHPNAKRPVVSQEVGYEAVEPNRRFISICRNYVAILCYEVIDGNRRPRDYVDNDEHLSDSQFFIIDWETGDLIWRINDAIRSFTFISENLVLLALSSNSKDAPLSGVLAVVDFSNQHRASCYSVTSALVLPMLNTDSVASEIFVQSSPPPREVNQSTAFPDPIPFSTDPESRLITVNLFVHRQLQFFFCIPLSTIRRSMCGEAQEVTRLMDCVEQGLPWESWGPQGTRVILGPHTARFPTQMKEFIGIPGVCCAWGSRCTSEYGGAGRPVLTIKPKLFDFNPLLFKRKLHEIGTDERGENSLVLIDDSSTVDNSSAMYRGTDTCQFGITTSLPYVVRKRLRFKFYVIMFNEDHLIVIHRNRQQDDDGVLRPFDIYQIS